MDVGGNRKHGRFLVDDCTVEVRSTGLASVLSKGESLPVVDLGLGGMRFVSFVPLEVGQRLRLSLQVADLPGFVKAQGEVCWCERISGEAAYCAGADFIKLTHDDEVKLKRLEQSYGPRQREILSTGIYSLGVPRSVADKLVDMIIEGLKRRPRLARDLLEEQDEAAGAAGDLWVDVPRGRRTDEDDGPDKAEPESQAEAVEREAQPRADDRPANLDQGGLAELATADDAQEGAPGPLQEHAAPEPETPLTPTGAEEAGAGDAPSAAEPSPPSRAPAEPDEDDRHFVPLFLLGEGRRIRLGPDRLPADKPTGKVLLPGFGPSHIACRIADDSMVAEEGRSFRVGDVVVFDTTKRVEEGAYALVAAKGLRCLRQVFNVRRSKLVLKALNPAHEDTHLLARKVKAIWPCVAHLQLL